MGPHPTSRRDTATSYVHSISNRQPRSPSRGRRSPQVTLDGQQEAEKELLQRTWHRPKPQEVSLPSSLPASAVSSYPRTPCSRHGHPAQSADGHQGPAAISSCPQGDPTKASSRPGHSCPISASGSTLPNSLVHRSTHKAAKRGAYQGAATHGCQQQQ